ncbi:hypothetical protein [Mesorhizobium sp. ANAO-SY3R2]|uniref:hypothetical protein n=1 Tax=Mesorhizobium sp. ANAO-SY3R2 TaxID=3166644 RepID=UPI00366B01AF
MLRSMAGRLFKTRRAAATSMLARAIRWDNKSLVFHAFDLLAMFGSFRIPAIEVKFDLGG